MTAPLLPYEDAFRKWISDRGIRWERIELPIGADGAETASYRFTPAGSVRRTVVALHGAGNDALFAWIGLFKRMLLAGSQVFTFDLPGHGRHTRTRFGPLLSIESARSAVDLCSAEAGGRPLHAVGVSLGGSVLLSALPDFQDRVSSAALVVAPLRIVLSMRSMARELGPKTVALIWREREHYGLTGLIPSFGSFKREIYPLRLEVEPPPGSFGYVHALNDMLRGMKLEESAARIRIPTLLVYGTRDRIVPAEQGERIAAALPSAELLRVDGGTHLSTPLDPTATERLARWLSVTER